MTTIISSELTNYGRRIYAVEHLGYVLNVYDPENIADLDRRVNTLQRLEMQEREKAMQELIDAFGFPSETTFDQWVDCGECYTVAQYISDNY